MMKRSVMFGLVALMLLTTAFAALYANSVRPSLSFSGNEAICKCTVVADDANAEISVEMTLYQGSSVVDSWSDSGTGFVRATGYATVDMGDYYTLEVEATINGRTYTDSVGGMCE